jgi:GT2 family glycosyltransferase
MIERNISFSVLMPLFFKEKARNLDVALSSIYEQTLPPDEIVLVKEGVLGSDLLDVINKWKNKQSSVGLTIIDADKEGVRGLPECLNLGLRYIQTEYVARFDSDDENCLDRFEKQLRYLRNNPDVCLLGGIIVEMDEEMNSEIATRKVPSSEIAIRRFAQWRNPFNHQTVIYRTDIAKKMGGYPEIRANEDYAFWGKFMSNGYKVKNLPEILVKARTGDSLYTRRRGKNYLKGELQSLRSLYDSKFFNKTQYCRQIVVRTLIRLLPKSNLKAIYNLLRK